MTDLKALAGNLTAKPTTKIEVPLRDLTIIRQNALTQANNWNASRGLAMSEEEFFAFAERCVEWVLR